ncbi:PhzF family phenazine biosynthesis protein [Pontibacter qinzhouensis]|uniref:PhzF family phenazine biosynthesis protein n=1 Tax=Pontibacter qinzhouensis TaxID=2603253 RepID=A0A5C8JM09_9BACT|nr:PhzF family phenazine biosynthesis protein [Pontibacter qinzhouensis]TXK37873.1 PhzF family phenazine biosynthesis protein [Pontibacter qinzhouensis]
MQKLTLYQIDAFTDKVFGGNPAAVCVLDQWLEEEKMQQIAAENNLAETAFVVKTGSDYSIRWFTPTVEVDLCGHATLAAAFVLFSYHHLTVNAITFHSHRSGLLTVEQQGEELTLNFPTDVLEQVEVPETLTQAFGVAPEAAFKGKTDYLLLFASEEDIVALHPDLRVLAGVAARGVIVSAPGKEVDFVSRFFAPQVGVDEDPVTGSAHTTLIPYWSQRLGKQKLTARQLSKRQGELTCEFLGDRVAITGNAVAYLKGEIYV